MVVALHRETARFRCTHLLVAEYCRPALPATLGGITAVSKTVLQSSMIVTRQKYAQECLCTIAYTCKCVQVRAHVRKCFKTVCQCV